MKTFNAIIVVAIIVAVVVIGAVAIYYFTQNQPNNQTVYTVQNATSLQVHADVVGSNHGTANPFNWSVANVGATNQKIRLTIYANASDQTGYTYIINSQDQTAWKNENGTWISDNYNDSNSLWGGQWEQFLSQLKANWTGNGNVQFTSSLGDNVTITSVTINPNLPDSLFAPTT
jgi:hypothetical protein